MNLIYDIHPNQKHMPNSILRNRQLIFSKTHTTILKYIPNCKLTFGKHGHLEGSLNTWRNRQVVLFVPDLKKLIKLSSQTLQYYYMMYNYSKKHNKLYHARAFRLFTKLVAFISSYFNTFVTVDGVSGLTAQNHF